VWRRADTSDDRSRTVSTTTSTEGGRCRQCRQLGWNVRHRALLRVCGRTYHHHHHQNFRLQSNISQYKQKLEQYSFIVYTRRDELIAGYKAVGSLRVYTIKPICPAFATLLCRFLVRCLVAQFVKCDVNQLFWITVYLAFFQYRIIVKFLLWSENNRNGH